jgi:hypothetical protein
MATAKNEKPNQDQSEQGLDNQEGGEESISFTKEQPKRTPI